METPNAAISTLPLPLQLLITFLSSGVSITLVICLFKYLMRKTPKSEKKKYDSSGNLIESETIYR